MYRFGYSKVDALVITYMKNGKIKEIILETKEYLKSEVNEICKSFIKKTQLDNNTILYNDYFNIGIEDLDSKLKALEKYNKKYFKKKYIQKSIAFLLLIITFMFFCYILFKFIL